ncbi:hypothetical protein FB451DRAFT_1238075 [Mycena latifolia]|nr:hypothetical protein FB451DRAFT_1238075 [Mycena latifolia]
MDTSDISASSLRTLRCLQITADQTVPLRHSVLWPDAPVSHVLLPEDAAGWHFGAFVDSKPHPVAVISLFAEACPEPIDNGSRGADNRGENDGAPGRAIRFRKFACDPAYQGQGIGTKLLLHVISTTKAWYERRGLAPFGDVFWKGSVKYVRMRIDIDTA